MFSNTTEHSIGIISMLAKTVFIVYILYLQAYKHLDIPNLVILVLEFSSFGLSSLFQRQKHHVPFNYHYLNLLVGILATLTYFKKYM